MGLFYQPKNNAETRGSQRILLETLIVFALTVIPALLWPSFKIVSVFLPIAYLLIERRLRKRPWTELGFDARGIKPALVANWFLILLEVFVIQVAVALLAKTFRPALLTHLESRIPLFDRTQLTSLVGMTLFTTLGGRNGFPQFVSGANEVVHQNADRHSCGFCDIWPDALVAR